jgi:hypothetical protein
MRATIGAGILAVVLVPSVAWGDAGPLTRDKAEMIGRVEDFFLHNFRDVTWRKSVGWGDVTTREDGSRTIRYTYEALIWEKDRVVMNQEFTFGPDGAFLRFENVAGPKKTVRKKADVSTLKGMKALVDKFFAHNFRDVTGRQTLAWGKPIKDERGNTSIAYKYEATIWGKDKKVLHQVFTFDSNGKFVSVKDAE